VSRRFREIAKQLKKQKRDGRARFKEHILDSWAKLAPATKKHVGDFKGALTVRDWMAHGRWFDAQAPRKYSPEDVFDISNNLLQVIGA
jgi:hypothetical protein